MQTAPGEALTKQHRTGVQFSPSPHPYWDLFPATAAGGGSFFFAQGTERHTRDVFNQSSTMRALRRLDAPAAAPQRPVGALPWEIDRGHARGFLGTLTSHRPVVTMRKRLSYEIAQRT